jgi:hypothetical protein
MDTADRLLLAAYYAQGIVVAHALTNLSAATTMVMYAPTTEHIALDVYCEALTARRIAIGPLVEQSKIHALQVDVGVFGVTDLLNLAEHYRRKASDNSTPAPIAIKDPS